MYGRIVLYAAYQRPVGLSAVHLRARASVYGQRRYADILQPQGYLFDVLALVAPPQTRLYRDGLAHGLDYAAGHLDHQVGVAHHARAGAACGYLLDGTSEIYVDYVGVGLLGYKGGLDHRLDLMTVNLYADGAFEIRYGEFGTRFPCVAYQSVRRYEFGIDHICAEPLAHVAERRVGNILHGCQKQRLVAQVYRSDLHLVAFCGQIYA